MSDNTKGRSLAKAEAVKRLLTINPRGLRNHCWVGYLGLLVLNVGNGWEWGNGMIIDSYGGSFLHSLLSTSKLGG